MNVEELRKEALETAKRQKKSWLELGKVLHEINDKESFREWGFEAFKDYFKEELGLNGGTVKQLIEAYEYIKANNPSLLNTIEKQDDTKYIPDFQAVASLSKAVKNDAFESDEQKKEYTERVFSEEVGEAEFTKKEIKDILAQKDKKDGGEILEEISVQKNKLKRQVKNLDKKLHECSAFDTNVLEVSERLLKLVEEA